MLTLKLPLEEIFLLHKRGDKAATACLITFFDGLICKYSRDYSTRKIDPDIKSEMTLRCIIALNKFDENKYFNPDLD